MSIRVLIVDDSALMRALLQRRLDSEQDIEVIGTASCAKEARAMIKSLNPDVVTLDIEMPGMDGLSFLEKIMELRPTPVIIVSGSAQEGTHTTVRALQLGAVGCYAKTDRYGEFPHEDGGRLSALVREAAAVDLSSRRKASRPAPMSASQPATEANLVVIGSSTGGVEALHTLLGGFPRGCPPTVIVQHVNACFAGAIARSLDSSCEPRVVMAQSGTLLEKGTVYFAPGGDRHLRVAQSSKGGFRALLKPGPAINGHLPSVDALFQSAAQASGAKTIGILLTGMGNDGAAGLSTLAKAGAHTIAQDEASCIVFGMPRAAIELGAAKQILPLDKIAESLFANAEVKA